MRRDQAPPEELSALLDGTLDPEARARLEARLAIDPLLAEELRGLRAVRDLVAALPRPAPGLDISARVQDAIRSGQVSASSRARLLRMPPRAAWGLRVAATAAALLALASLPVLIPKLLAPEEGPVVVAAHRQPLPSPPTAAPGPARVAEADAPPAVAADPTRPATALVPAAEELALDRENEKFRRLLDSPSLRKVFVVADDADPSGRVDWILRDRPRRYANYVRMSIAEALNPDPERPGDASVYAVVMDDREVERLRQDLALAFPLGTIEETAPRPELVTRLAEVGRAEVFEGTAVADLIEPAAGTLASRRAADDHIRLNHLQAAFRLPPEIMARLSDPADGPPAVADEPSPPDVDLATPAAAPTAGAEPARPSRSVVLIWTVRRGPMAALEEAAGR